MKKGLATLLAAITAGLLTLGAAAPAYALPTPSPELPADIYANDGGISFSYVPDLDSFANVPLGDPDFVTAYEREQHIVFNSTITNRYWQSLELIGAEQTDQLVTDTSATVFNSNAPETPASLGLTETFTGTSGAVAPIGVVGSTIANGDTQPVSFTVNYPRSNVEYRDTDGTLAAYGYQGKVSLFFRGIATDGQAYIFTASIALNSHTPAFSDITTGAGLECANLPVGEPCANVSAYGYEGTFSPYPYAPLAAPEDPTDPPSGVVPTSPTCTITAITSANGELEVTARLDVHADDQGTTADYAFPINDTIDVGQTEVLTVSIEDQTNGFTEEEELNELLPYFNWSTSAQTVTADSTYPSGSVRTFTGTENTYTFTDQALTPSAARELDFTMELTDFVSGETGSTTLVTCSTTAAVPQPPVVIEEPERLPNTGTADPTPFVIVGSIFVLLGLIALVAVYRKEENEARA